VGFRVGLKNLLPLLGIRASYPDRSLVAILAQLSQLQYVILKLKYLLCVQFLSFTFLLYTSMLLLLLIHIHSQYIIKQGFICRYTFMAMYTFEPIFAKKNFLVCFHESLIYFGERKLRNTVLFHL
jgi:hypothetical protein